MEKYTLQTNEEDLQLGRISVKEKFIFDKYLKAKMAADKISTELYEYLQKKYSDRIKKAEWDDLKTIHEELRWVPESVGKTLMFRAILFREGVLTVMR